MSMQRITISIPEKVHEQLIEEVGNSSVSKFVTEAVQDKIFDNRINKASTKEKPWVAMRRMVKHLPRMTTEEILEAIHKDRK